MASLIFQGSDFSTANASTYTFSDAIGTAAADRIVFVVVGARAGSSIQVTGVTLDGTDMAQVHALNIGSGSAHGSASIWALATPSGTSAAIVVRTNTTAVRAHIGVYAGYGLIATPVDVDGSGVAANSSAARAVTLDSAPNGYVLAAGTAGTGVTATWEGDATEDYDFTYESSGFATGASGLTSGQTTTVQYTPSAAANVPLLVAASFQPSSTAHVAAGTVAVVSSASGAITRQTTALGAVVSVSAASGTVSVQSNAIVVAGTVVSVSAASGSITKATTVAGAVVALSASSGTPGTITIVSGAVVSMSAASGAVRLRRPLSGAVSAYSTAMGALKMVQAPTLPPTVLLRPEATLTVAGKTMAAVSGDAVLDAARVPYASATVEVAVTNPDTVEAIDPRQGVRAALTASNAGVSSRTFNLGVRERTIDHAAKTMKLELASDEAMLIDYAPITQDLGAFEMQNSLRSIVNYVLGKVIPGTSLQAGGAPDEQFLVATDSTNLFPDPRYERTPEGGYSVINAQNIPDTTWSGTENLAGVHVYNPTSDDAFIQLTNNAGLPFGMQVGRSYTFSATGAVRSAMGGSEQTLRSRRLVAIGRVNGTYADLARSAAVPHTVDGGTRVSVSFTIPEGCDQILLRAYHGHTSGTITWRAFRLSESHDYPGPHNWQYFDGSRPSDGLYAYSWTGAPNASTSKRVALIDRAPELLAWEPGVSAWDFLSPIVTSVGLRLWCDENRVWRLTDPAEYTVPGVLSVNGFNAPEGEDTITRSDPEVFCTGIVVKYRWRDISGEQREAIDSAGVAGSVLIWEFDRPYPGPGAAAAMLTRRAGAGRVQEVTALIDYAATPGMEARITLPSTADQQGLLTSVSWSLTDGLMQVGTKGLLDLVKGSINALTGTIDQLTGTIDQL